MFSIRWRPYLLDYQRYIPAGTRSVDKSEVTKVKLAGLTAAQLATAKQRMDQTGRACGISFKWGGRIGSTRDAQSLIMLAQQQQQQKQKPIAVQNALVDGLFEAYHEQERDICSRDVLREVALAAGLEADEVDEWLDSDAGGKEFDEEAARNKETVGAGVPMFIIQRVHRVDGAQDPLDFLEIFAQIKEQEQQQEGQGLQGESIV